MDIGIVLLIALIVLSNLASFILGAWAFEKGAGISFFDAKGYPLPQKKKPPKKNDNPENQEDSVRDKYDNV